MNKHSPNYILNSKELIINILMQKHWKYQTLLQ